MNKLTEIRNQIDEFKRLENQYHKKMEEVKFEVYEQNKIAHWFGPPLNFVAREITKLVIESDLLSLLEEKDKAFERIIEHYNSDGTDSLRVLKMLGDAQKALNTSSNNKGEI
jgi:DNA repair ATPase RecN